MALLCVMFSCVFVTFPYGISGQVQYLIVSIPDICRLPYFSLAMHFVQKEVPLIDGSMTTLSIGPEVIKLVFKHNSTEHEIYPANKC